MKQFVRIIAILVISFSNLYVAQAQDIIHRKNGKTIEAKIIEINADDIKYKMFTQPSGAIITIDVALVKKIVFENGTIHKFEYEDNFSNPEYYEGQNRSAYKVSFLGPIMGYTTFTYERNLKPGRSVEARLGLVGLGKNIDDQKGAYITLGHKFYYKPDYYISRQRYGHLLKGSYIRPEVNLGSYKYNTQNTSWYGNSNITTKTSISKTYGSIMICAGKQWVFDNKFALDMFTGIGMGFLSSTKKNDSDFFDFDSSAYGNYVGKSGLAANIGFNIGILGK